MRIVFITILFLMLCCTLFSQVDTTIYSFDGKNQFIGQMLNGKQIGTWKELDSSGTLVRTIEIVSDKGKCKIIPNFKDSTFTGYYQGLFIVNKVILHGKYQIINELKQTKTEGNYWYDKKVGQSRYYKDGQLKTFDFHYKKSEEYLSIPFKNNGELLRISGMNNNGFQSGVFVDFDDSMRVSAVGYLDNGCKIGEWSYFKYGKLDCKGNYYPDYLHLRTINDSLFLVNKNDSLAREIYPDEVIKLIDYNIPILYLKHGKWYYFDSEGNIVKTECYDRGLLIINDKRKK